MTSIFVTVLTGGSQNASSDSAVLLTVLVPFCTSLTLAELITDGPKERLWAIIQYKVLDFKVA